MSVSSCMSLRDLCLCDFLLWTWSRLLSRCPTRSAASSESATIVLLPEVTIMALVFLHAVLDHRSIQSLHMLSVDAIALAVQCH
jgi:hypothetical protein